MIKHVTLIRHGETADNAAGIIQGWKDPGLNDNGKEQVRRAAHKIIPEQGIIFSSDLLRARESAAIIREVFALKDFPYYIDWRLRERSFGTLEGEPRDVEKMDLLFTGDPKAELYGSESEQAFSDRVWSFVQDLRLVKAENIYVVAHGGVLNRFGYLLDSSHGHIKHPNAAVITYDIDPLNAINEWEKRRENH